VTKKLSFVQHKHWSELLPLEHIQVKILLGGSHRDKCCESTMRIIHRWLVFLYKKKTISSSSSSSSYSFIDFVVKHHMLGVKIPNHLSPRFVCTRFFIWCIVVDGVDIHTSTTTEKINFKQCLKKLGKRLQHHMTMLPYDWSFHYLFDRNILHSFKWLSG